MTATTQRTQLAVWVAGQPHMLVLECTRHDCRCALQERRSYMRDLTVAERAALEQPQDGRHE